VKRKKYSNDLKTKVTLSAIKAQSTNNEIASEFGVHTSQVNRWKKQAIDGLSGVFGGEARENHKNYGTRARPPFSAHWQAPG